MCIAELEAVAAISVGDWGTSAVGARIEAPRG